MTEVATTNCFISIIIPAYNVETYIETCIESVLNQTVHNFEVILIDDGSTDGTLNKIRFFEKRDPRIHLIEQKNMGVSSARNRGLEYAKGDFIYFMDADDYIDLDTLEVLLKSYVKVKDIDLVICGYYVNHTPINIKLTSKHDVLNQVETMIEFCSIHSYKGYLGNKLFRHSIIRENHIIFDESLAYCEDSVFCFQYMQYANKSYYLNIPKYHYISRKESALQREFNPKSMSVLAAYEKIMELDKNIHNSKLTSYLRTNYITHTIRLLKKLIESNNKHEIENISFLCNMIEKNITLYIKSENATLKDKLQAFYILLYFKTALEVPHGKPGKNS